MRPKETRNFLSADYADSAELLILPLGLRRAGRIIAEAYARDWHRVAICENRNLHGVSRGVHAHFLIFCAHLRHLQTHKRPSPLRPVRG